jgi:acetyl esterase/lipase
VARFLLTARQAMKRLLLLALVVGCAAPREIEDVHYDERFDRTKLDLYLPDDDGPHGAVMFIHGGAWRLGDKRMFENAARRLARSGWAAASVNYRLVPDGRFPRAFQDVACALAFLQTHADEYDLDPERIVVMGYSAGGHLSSLLAVAWDDPQIAPDCAAGVPQPPAGAIPGAGVHDMRGRDHQWVEEFLGGTSDEIPETYAQASPITHVGPGEPPFLIISGGADWFVDIDQGREMRAELRASGNSAEVLSLAGGGHLLNPATDPGELKIAVSLDTPEAWLATADFLARTIGEP